MAIGLMNTQRFALAARQRGKDFMVAISDQSLLGVGLYTPAEAAMYARVSPQLFNRWMFGNQIGAAVAFPSLGTREDRLVTFADFVQAMAIRAMRLPPYKVPLSKIRQGIEVASDKYGVTHPFAVRHTTFLYGNELLIRTGKDSDELVQITGRERGRTLFSVWGMAPGDGDFPCGSATGESRLWLKLIPSPGVRLANIVHRGG